MCVLGGGGSFYCKCFGKDALSMDQRAQLRTIKEMFCQFGNVFWCQAVCYYTCSPSHTRTDGVAGGGVTECEWVINGGVKEWAFKKIATIIPIIHPRKRETKVKNILS